MLPHKTDSDRPDTPGPATPQLPDEVQKAHDDAVRQGQDGYIDPNSGLFVMTSAYLLAQEACCGSGCRHCPYEEP